MDEPIRVLHADDEPSFVEMAASLLEREDDQFVVETVSSASEGKRRLEKTPFDCVISDYEMPDENGIDFLRAVREEYPDLPFILFTGKGSEAVASEAISTGVTEYLQKQSGTEQYELLAHRIKNAVEQHQTAQRAETLDRIRTLVADISGALVRAQSRTEIETSVCEIISDAEPYQFSWIGDIDEETGLVEPRASVGIQEGYLEEMTARLKTQYRYLFEQAPVMAVTTKNQEGEPIIEDCDQLFAETTGYGKDEILGRPLSEFYTDESTETLRSGGYERALDGEFMRENRKLLTADGDTVETVLRAVPRPDRLEESDGTLALYINVTERERLKREKDRLEEFADIISHDLRNPLNVANGRLELARAECDSEHLDHIEQAHDRMETLIENLLALARGGDRPDATDSIDLSAAAKQHWRGVETGDVMLAIEGDTKIKADRSRLGQLLENLFRNSVEHSSTSSRTQSDDSVEHGHPRDGGAVSPDNENSKVEFSNHSMGSRPQADDAIEHGSEESSSLPDGTEKTVTVGTLPDDRGFYVEDNGTGIDSDDYETLFESGYSTAESGIGLGLAIVERIALAHGWEVAATESDSGGFRVEVTNVNTSESNQQ